MIILFVLILLVLLPAAAAFLSETSLLSRTVTAPAFGVGAPIVYQRQEISTYPTGDARDVRPSAHGEFYYYSLVDYLRVTHVLDDGRIIATARDATRYCFWPNDVRKARLTERFIYRWRFPHI
jgi:hypothetical protein